MQAVVGGMIAGFGARLAMGCNLAAFFTGIPQFSLHAWFFAVATAIGSYFGAKFTLLPLFRIPVKMVKVSAASPLTQSPPGASPLPPGYAGLFRHAGVGAVCSLNQPNSVWRCCLAWVLACSLNAHRSALPRRFAICGSPAAR
jgi:uncharacterized membrane protein YedE/YeeE